MIITHHTGEFIKVVFGNTTLAFNPISKKSKLAPTRFGADVVLMTLNHSDMNGIEEVTRGDKEPFVVAGPGEYEVGGVLVKGVGGKSTYGGDERINTIYAVRMEEINLLFLGAQSEKQFDMSIVEDMESVDIMFVPIGGDGVLTPAHAHALSVAFEAKVIIPIHYDGVGEKDSLKTFFKEAGMESVKPVDKLTIKKKDVELMNGEVVVIKS